MLRLFIMGQLARGAACSVGYRHKRNTLALGGDPFEARPRARSSDPKAVKRVGVHWATEQCRDLLDNQVRGIYFYTLNRSDATRQIYQNLGLQDSTLLRSAPRQMTT